MLRANVGLSRKISRDYNSTGYSVNLDGEIPVSVDDPSVIMEKVKELFSLAQEALAQEIDRDQGEDAIGRRDEERTEPRPYANGTGNNHPQASGNGSVSRPQQTNGNGSPQAQADAATNKQIQFLLNMGKRFKLSMPQLEAQIAQILGRRCGVYELTKKEAGVVLEHFTKSSNGNGQQGR